MSATIRAQLTEDRHGPIMDAVRRHWGFGELRPLQAEAIDAAVEGRDALVVLPTGGGKSLCYQVPPLVTGRMSIVVSPLIALMKDQVDGLRLAGYPAGAVHSHLSGQERAELRAQVASGDLRLLLVAPERLLSEDFLAWLSRLEARGRGVGGFAIDEAHCISQWGHDFRPEYRRLAILRERFPGVPIQAFTATATPRVQSDIIEQLNLRTPAKLVGTFDRPNLTYRILPRVHLAPQVGEALRRHEGRAAIIYCISRKDTESLAGDLRAMGLNAAAYHAGMDGPTRTRIQDDFRNERLNIVVATVAFGMGIDRSDVRCVIHASMPKSIEHYQQETGRAGRDGLPAECLLLYSSSDVARWGQLIEASASEAENVEEVVEAQRTLLEAMRRQCTAARCRHRSLSEYFGQAYERDNCGACDFCLDELELVPDSGDAALKVLSCVARLRGGVGAAHVADVLTGRNTKKIRERGHDRLPVFGLLRGRQKEEVISYINQIVDAGLLLREEGRFPLLHLTEGGVEAMRDGQEVRLYAPKRQLGTRPAGSKRRGDRQAVPLSAEEAELCEALRGLRREMAERLGVPPYVVFSDATLEEMARTRPSSEDSLVRVRGVGQAKLAEFGERFLECIRRGAERLGLDLDVRAEGETGTPGGKRPTVCPPRAEMRFNRGESVQAVAEAIGRAESTVWQYLEAYVRQHGPKRVDAWVDAETYDAVRTALRPEDGRRLRPIFDRLDGRVPYEQIRVVVAHSAAEKP